MEKLNELVELADEAIASSIYSLKVKVSDILAISEAFRALEQRAEAAEAKLAELEKQEPMGRVDRGSVTDSNEYPDARVVCLHEHVGWEAFQDGTELFTRPAPAINLAELVPEQSLNGQARFLGDKEPYYNRGWNDCRAAILRNIEEAK